MSLLDNLFSAFTGQPPAQASSYSAAPPVGQTAGSAPPVDDVTVTGGGRPMPAAPPTTMNPPTSDPTMGAGLPSVTPQGPQSSGLNYDNSQQVRDVNSALDAEGPPRGGMANPGLYGLLPPNMQHGTLRNVLGALGDAMLVQAGKQPEYEQRMQRQELGNAMAGMDPNNPDSMRAGFQRMAATGATDAMTDVDAQQKNYNDVQLRKATLEQNNWYRTAQTNDRNQNIYARQAPMAQGMVSAAKTSQDYAQRYQILDGRAKAIDPNMDASSAYGIPRPEDWAQTPGYGMTSNQQSQEAGRNQRDTTTRRGQDIGYQGRVQAAAIGAGGHVEAARIGAARPTEADIDQGVVNTENSGQPLSPGQANWEARHTPRTSRRPVPTGSGGGYQPVTSAQMRTLGPGATNGGGGARPGSSDISYLKSHPNMRAAFDSRFGQGASARILGR